MQVGIALSKLKSFPVSVLAAMLISLDPFVAPPAAAVGVAGGGGGGGSGVEGEGSEGGGGGGATPPPPPATITFILTPPQSLILLDVCPSVSELRMVQDWWAKVAKQQQQQQGEGSASGSGSSKRRVGEAEGVWLDFAALIPPPLPTPLAGKGDLLGVPCHL
jgi:hypothetical protein